MLSRETDPGRLAATVDVEARGLSGAVLVIVCAMINSFFDSCEKRKLLPSLSDRFQNIIRCAKSNT
jgi:hypothetical protein